MLKKAEASSAEDEKVFKKIEAKNGLESMAYSVKN